ncbi:MAG: hypothetical protein ACRC0G_07430 [Fusobacteriaceae bacterium]
MLNEAQRRLHEDIIFTQSKTLMKDQHASTKLKRQALDPKDHIIPKVAAYASPYSSVELVNKTVISYPTALTRDYIKEFKYCTEWKTFSCAQIFSIINTTIDVYVNRKKIWYKNIEFRVRKDQFLIIIPIVNSVQDITVFESHEAPKIMTYQSVANSNVQYDWIHGEHKLYPVAHSAAGNYNHMSIQSNIGTTSVVFKNDNWVGNEYELSCGRFRTLKLDLSSGVASDDPKFIYEKSIGLLTTPVDPLSIKLFNKNMELMLDGEYELNLVFKSNTQSTNGGAYVYIIKYNTLSEYYMVIYDISFTQLKQFSLKNIVSRYDHYHNYSYVYNSGGKLPNFIDTFNNLELDQSDTGGTEDQSFIQCMTKAIRHNPENYNRYLDTIETRRKYVKVKNMDPTHLTKINNRSEVESRFQVIDFLGEHVLLTMRNTSRSNNIGIYFNGLKYVGIRNIMHARRFTYIYINKDALPEKIDVDKSYFEIEIKSDAYASFSHSSRFNGDAMLLVDVNDPNLLNLKGDITKLKFFVNGKCIRRNEVFYTRDTRGDHSFFFNIKIFKGDVLSVEYSDQIFNEITYMNTIPNNGVVAINKSPFYKYPISSKYYEIYVNGRRMASDNEHFISNYAVQFKDVRGGHNVVIYEKRSIDVSALNDVFTSSADDWDAFVKSGDINVYTVPNVISEEASYNLNIYSIAKYRSHLLYWWLFVPRSPILESNPTKVSDNIFTEIFLRYTDFLNSKNEVILDAHTAQTSIMLVGNQHTGKIKNVEYVMDTIVSTNPPSDSNTMREIPDLPCKLVYDKTVEVDSHLDRLSGLRMVPNTEFKPKK